MNMTLEKILQSQGFGSRKHCRSLILGSRVAIGGETCTDPDTLIETGKLVFSIDGEPWAYREKLYLMLHKPAGYECSHQPQHHQSVFSLLPQPFINRGIQCVGRLDQDTTGLLLLSDDGQFIHQYTSPKKNIPKIYHITAIHPVTPEQAGKLETGVILRDEKTVTKALACRITGERSLSLTITEGKYHQVKRMVAAAGNRVDKLHRSAIGDLVLPDTLPAGHWCFLDKADLQKPEENSTAHT